MSDLFAEPRRETSIEISTRCSELEESDTAEEGQDSVQAMHDIFMREQAEPRDGFEPVPKWVPVVFAFLLMWGGYYLGANSGDFRRDAFDTVDVKPVILPNDLPAVSDPDPKTVSELMKLGEAKYRNVCIACHKSDGNGDSNPSQPYPPLAGSEWVSGTEASASRQVRIVLYGLNQTIQVKGKFYNGQMPAQGGAMTDYEIASVITFVRNSFGHKSDADDANPAVTTALVKTVRVKLGKRESMTAKELQKLALDFSDLAIPKLDGNK